ncbi:ATP-binding protein [Brevibacterium casei]|uniref:sensor histidine kinase n=1 Tax=Brevibacterium casei TaxID=33889 RepID=UPI00223B3027|nr:ATP-binding protein [Brevibacterium casei]MCT2183519.1 ATP-binding protein [Brevibacterium casei]
MTPGFIVDTHLLRELGDLLVGRDSTAVLELVKNGYDADASVIRIDAEQLGDPQSAVLTVEDDGNGMTLERFQAAFLRIAGRDKEEGERTSPRFHRAYTGQKGIGRLASQKLAKQLEVSSRPNDYVATQDDQAVSADIDWEEIDRQDRLDQLARGLEVKGTPINKSLPSGTTLTLRALKRKWTRAEIANFVNELQTAQPPSYIMGADANALALTDPPLFSRPQVRNTAADDPGFTIELTGDLDSGDDLWLTAADSFNWCVEIDVEAGRVHYRITPTLRYAETERLARPYHFEAATDSDIRFQARFFVMPNASARGPLGGFTRAHSGVRIYLEGFRVLPYGEYGDDWLEINRDYRGGARYYTIELDADASDEIEFDRREGLNAIGSNGYYGAVFLTTSGAPDLESLINREGFVPGRTFDVIRSVVQNGVRLSVRVRRSVHNQREALKARQLASQPVKPSVDPDTRGNDPEEHPSPPGTHDPPRSREPYDLFSHREPGEQSQQAMQAAAAAAAQLAQTGDTDDSASDLEVRALVDGFQAAREVLQSVQSIQPELRTLAGVGLQLGAFVHDINGMLASTTTIRELLKGVLSEARDRDQRRELQAILRTADELAHVLARQSSYLTDVLSTDPRRRRSRVPVRERTDSVLRFLAGRIIEKEISVHTEIQTGLKTPPMFPAEVMILLTNLLTNAVKNAAQGGNIWIDAREAAGGNTEIVITNDGTIVNLDESERWFLPFESTTTSVDEVLGQGLGLGLPIVRAIADDYHGDVRFVASPHGDGTAVRVQLTRKER